MIDNLKLDIYKIAIASVFVEDKKKRSYFCKKTFILYEISIYIALKMFFLTLNNVEIDIIISYLY